MLHPRLALAAATIVALTAIAAPPQVSAYDRFTEYIYSTSSCGSPTDPINVYFEPGIGQVGTALSLIQNRPVLGWGDNTGSGHYFYNTLWSSSSRCRFQDYQRASSCIACARDHGRLKGGPWVSGVGYVSAFPVHYELVDEYCGNHVVITFNGERDSVAQKFRDAGYSTVRTYVGNTRGFTQCNGAVVRSDGYIDRLRS